MHGRLMYCAIRRFASRYCNMHSGAFIFISVESPHVMHGGRARGSLFACGVITLVWHLHDFHDNTLGIKGFVCACNHQVTNDVCLLAWCVCCLLF